MIGAFAAIAFLSAAIIVPYLMDLWGLPIVPLAVLPAAALAASAVFLSVRRETRPDRDETIAFTVIVAAVLTGLLWNGRPSWLPPGSGPDLVHHLLLIDYIERHAQLPHDPQLGALLGEMVNYTPGAHLLASLAGAWTRTNGLQALYPIVALAVALKAGLIFLIARRMMPAGVPRTPFAVVAVLLLFVPRNYFLGSFTELSFLAQVVSELFAVAMWLALVKWDERPSTLAAGLFALTGTATFLTWPVWVGPLLLVFAAVVAFRSDLAVAARVRALALGTIPIAIVAAVHASNRVAAVTIVAGAGFVEYPTVAMFGRWLLLLAGAGVIVAALVRRTRTVTLVVVAIALQAGVLYMVATGSGAARPYFALKMVYLAIYPLAVAASLALAEGLRIVMGGMGRIGRMGGMGLLPWIAVLALAVVVSRPLVAAARPKPIVSRPLYLAGQWARANVAPECVDYLVDDGNTAYWLHIAVLGNARAAPRSRNDDTYQPRKAAERWILPGGLPYAIVQDFEGLPKDIRTSVDIIARFGPAAVVTRRGPSSCPPG